jgi:ribosomal-protein-alanine acetyltransferase
MPADSLAIRPATLDDLDALDAVETRVFSGDRISRRSFRRFLQSPKDELLVAARGDRLVGYALVLFRAGTALARLYSLAVLPEAAGQGVGSALLKASEEAAAVRDCLVLRLEVRADNAGAVALYRSRGYRQFGRHEDYYEDHADALRLEKRLVPDLPPPPAAPPYFRQTTDFTCAPACMAMALAWASPALRPDPVLELQLWREATTIFMTSGPGGCEPYGIATALKKRGLRPAVHVSQRGPFFLDGVRSEDKKRVMRVAQAGFQAEAEALGVPIHVGPFGDADLSVAFARGEIAIVLVSGYRMYRQKAPHWVLAFGRSGRHVFMHDPWVEPRDFETSSTMRAMPVPLAEFQRMSRYGRDNLRATILIAKGETP